MFFLFHFAEATNWFLDSEILPNRKFPIIFEDVKGLSEHSSIGSSIFNKKEIDTVLFYIENFLNGNWNGREAVVNDIGVVSPYRQQCSLIQKECRRRGYEAISVGTAEIFQGQEKKIMIISTVRSDGQLDFVEDEKVSVLKSFQKINEQFNTNIFFLISEA